MVGNPKAGLLRSLTDIGPARWRGSTKALGTTTSTKHGNCELLVEWVHGAKYLGTLGGVGGAGRLVAREWMDWADGSARPWHGQGV